jgi:acyl carrier protein phosphodiesterase
MFNFESQKIEEQKNNNDLSASLEKQYSSLGLDPETLKSNEFFEEFDSLNESSKMMVLKNLRSIILKDVNNESREGISGDSNGFLSKIKRNKEFKKNRELELKTLEDIGLDNYKEGKYSEIFSELSKAVSAFEIEIERKEDDSVEASFLSADKNYNSKEKEMIEGFNESANKFLNIPKEWAYDLKGSNKEKNQAYKEVLEEYINKKTELYDTLLSKDPKILEKINKADWQVKILRDFKNDSVLEDDWSEALENKGFFKKTISKMTTKENAAYTGAGFATRSIAGFLSASVAALPAVMAIGGIRGAKRGKEELAKKDKERVYKEKENNNQEVERKKIREEIRKIVPDKFALHPEKWASLEGTEDEDFEKYNKLLERLNVLNKQNEKESKMDLNISSASDLSVKLRSLIDSFESMPKKRGRKSAETKEREAKIIESLLARINFTKDKLNKELVSFGDVGRLSSFIDLKASIEEAESFVNIHSAIETNSDKIVDISERLASISIIRKGKLESARHRHVMVKAVKGMATAGAFFSVGSLISEISNASTDFNMDDVEVVNDENIIKEEQVEEFIDEIYKVEERVNETDTIKTDTIKSEEIVEDQIVKRPNIKETTDIIGEELEGLEKIGEIKKTVTMEKGDGVSKIFDGKMNNEYEVNFVDNETGEIEKGAAFSKMIHPGDEVILAEDGEVYVVCKNGINENPLYDQIEDVDGAGVEKSVEVEGEEPEIKSEDSPEEDMELEEEYFDELKEKIESEIENEDISEESMEPKEENSEDSLIKTTEADSKKEDIEQLEETETDTITEKPEVVEDSVDREKIFNESISSLVEDSSNIEAFLDLVGEDFIRSNNLKISSISSDYMDYDYRSIMVENAAGNSIEVQFYNEGDKTMLDIRQFDDVKHLGTESLVVKEGIATHVIKKSIEDFLIK